MLDTDAPRAATTTFLRLGVPQLPERWLRRPRLLARLSETGGGETMLVAALAGSGKTMLIADWFTNERTIDGGWVSLAPRDDEPGLLASKCASALGFDDVAAGGFTVDGIVFDRLFDALEARGTAAVLVIDDVHELRSRAAMDALQHLTAHAPPLLTLVLATRADPPIALHRLALAGRLHQVRTADLAFNVAETAQLLRLHGVELDGPATESLQMRTAGWAGGLRLAATALASGCDRQRFVDEVVQTQSVISDFLLTEVFDRQPANMQRFLLATSVAGTLTVELARDLSGDEKADSRLRTLERAGLVTSVTTHGAAHYDFHALFGALLRARLRHQDPDLARRLADRAAGWYVRHDMFAEAEAHAFDAGNWVLAGELACRRWVARSVHRGTVSTIDLPVRADVCGDVADLAVLMTVNAIASGDRRAARMWRARADALARSDRVSPWSAAARLLADVMYARAFGADTRGRLAVRALMRTDLGDDTGALQATARLREAEMDFDVNDDHEPAVRALVEARWRASRFAVPWVVDASDTLLALVAALRGLLTDIDTLLGSIPKHDDDSLGLADVRRLAKAVSAAQRARVATARELLGEPSSPATAHAVTVGIDEARARTMGATLARDLPAHPLAEAVRTAFGVLDHARPGSAEAQVQRARQLWSKGNVDEIVPLLGRFARGKDQHVHVRTRIEALALVAFSASRLDDDDLAVSALTRALELAQNGDLRAPLIAYSDVLAHVVDGYAWRLGDTSAYAADLADTARDDSAPVFVEPLTERERAVLGYLPTMMSNAEIARQLLMSVNTVKTHLKSVYRKLGVDRRRDAVLRARQFELL